MQRSPSLEKNSPMGSLGFEQAPTSLVNDLKVSLHRSSTLTPLEKTERRTMFISNIEQPLNFDVETIHFFKASPNFTPENVADQLEVALTKLLVPYDFLAGRLRFNPQVGRLEIECNGAGVAFAVASSALTLEEIGDVAYPNPAFRQLTFCKEPMLGLEDRPLVRLQVTSFKCGGFAMGFANNHTLFDGLAFKLFLENLASVAWGKPLALAPNNDRHLLRARSPPRVAFSHPELTEFPPVPPGQECQLNIFEPTPDNLRFKVFKVSSDDLAGLKEKAKDGGASGPSITGFNVLTAHIWRCWVLAKATDGDWDPEKTHTVLYAVDIRSRLQPPLPRSYTGNAVVTGYGATTRRELEGGSFSRLVEAVREGNTRVSDEYARSIIDWGQLHRGYPRGDVIISSWWRLGLGDVDFPWGKPFYFCPVMIPTMDIVIFYPDVESADYRSSAINVCVALPPENINKFESLFYKYLA